MTKADVARQLRHLGLRPQQAAGQNFLLDEDVVERMITSAKIEAGDQVLEIGPGLGILTKGLLDHGAEVVAVELDRRLAAFLTTSFQAWPGLTLVHDDIFRIRLADVVNDGDYKLVANLPYSATSLIFRNFLSLQPRPTSLTVMVQRDVADRITAEPGQLSVLAVMVQYYARVERVMDVPRSSFYPEPRVDSSVLHLDRLQNVQDGDRHLFRIIRAGFSARRKQLQNSLAATLHRTPVEIGEKLLSIGVQPTARAQEIPVQTWPKISQVLS